MNQEIKEKWVAALRSGDYGQTIGYLHNEIDGGYCCLGVLCEIAVQEGVAEIGKVRDGAVYYRSGDGDSQSTVLPQGVIEWAGLEDESPRAADRTPATVNDNGTPFAEIADLIEQHL